MPGDTKKKLSPNQKNNIFIRNMNKRLGNNTYFCYKALVVGLEGAASGKYIYFFIFL